MSQDLFQQRLQKIELWKELGFKGYAISFDRTHTSKEAIKASEEKELRAIPDIMGKADKDIAVCGRIMNSREMGKLAFLKIRDIDGDFQICLSLEVLGDDFKKWLKALDLGDYCGFKGELFVTKKGEPTLMAVEITPLSKALRPLPEKWQGLKDREQCYRQRNLDLATNPETHDRFVKRSQIVAKIRDYFNNKNFHELETRILQPQAGGAMAQVFETHHNALDHDFSLRIATELDLKMACSGGLERVYEIGRLFRNEGIDPSHLQEFTSIEWYGAYDTLEEHSTWIEELLRSICTDIFKKTEFELMDKDENWVTVDFSKPFATQTFAELLKEYANIDMFKASLEDLQKKAKELGIDDVETRGRGNLLDDIYKKTARINLVQPVFVTNWPSDLKPLARPHGDGTSSVSQLVIAGWEVTNGYGELIDPTVQRQLLEDQQNAKDSGDDEAMEIDEEFLRAMEHGFPPMAGNAIGIDRIVALLTGQPNLRDVVLFPTMKPEKKKEEKTDKNTLLAVALINQDLDLKPWEQMNTIGHLSAVYGSREGTKLFYADKAVTSDAKDITMNTQHAIIIKQIEDGKAIGELLKKSESAGVKIAEFTRDMIKSSDDKKVISEISKKSYDEVEHLGVMVYGKKSEVEKLTKGFELLS